MNYTIAVINQRLYLLNQLRKQGLDIHRFTYGSSRGALPICNCLQLPDSFLDDNCNRFDPVFSKEFRWQLTSILPSAADMVHKANQ